VDGLFPRRPILSSSNDGVRGVAQLAYRMTELSGTRPRTRSGHVSRWGPYLEINSTTATSLTVADYRVVPGYVGLGATPTKTTLTVYLYALMSAASSTGEWRVVSGSGGASVWSAVTATAGTWHTLTTTLNAEDPSTSNGLRGGSADTLRFEARNVSGAGKIRVYGWCVVE